MAGEFGDSPGKQAVRELWNTPVLKYLNQQHNLRFRYLGLPGEDYHDITLWKDMIDEVVAFELEGKPDAEYPDGRRAIANLSAGLERIGMPYKVYVGAMEEVILSRVDIDGEKYNQGGLVTLLNLDFCDEITSKVKVKPNRPKVSRYRAIKQILADQKAFFDESKSRCLFLFLITVRDSTQSREIDRLLKLAPLLDTKNFVDKCSETKPLPPDSSVTGTHTWCLKAFLYDTLKQYFAGPDISSVMFPIVKYIGKSGASPMFHMMLLCSFSQSPEPLPPTFPANYLTDASCVRAANNVLSWEPGPAESSQGDTLPNPVSWLKSVEADFISQII